MRLTLALTLVGSFLAEVGTIHGAELVAWSVNGFINSAEVLPANRVASEVSASPLGLSMSVGGVFAADAYVGTGWPTGAAADTTRYLEFGVGAKSGYGVTFSTIRFSLHSDGGGNATWQVRSSADEYASVLDSGTAVNISGSGATVVADISELGTREGATLFRIYFYNNTGLFNRDRRGLSGTNLGGIGLSVNGEVLPVVSDQPRVDRIFVANGLVHLDISGLPTTASTTVQQADPFPAATWSDIETFVNTTSSLSWTTTVSVAVGRVLFRLQMSP